MRKCLSDDSVFASPENAERLHGREDILSDKLFRFQQDLKVVTLNEACHSLRRRNQFSKMKSEYTGMQNIIDEIEIR